MTNTWKSHNPLETGHDSDRRESFTRRQPRTVTIPSKRGMIQIFEVPVVFSTEAGHNPLETGHDSDCSSHQQPTLRGRHNPLETGHDSDGFQGSVFHGLPSHNPLETGHDSDRAKSCRSQSQRVTIPSKRGMIQIMCGFLVNSRKSGHNPLETGHDSDRPL